MYRRSRRLITAGYVVFIGILILSSSVYVINRSGEQLREDLGDRLTSEAHIAAELVSGSEASSQSIAERLSRQTGNRFTILDADGQILGDSRAAVDTPLDISTESEIATALDGGVSLTEEPNPVDNRDEFGVVVPIWQENDIIGALRVATPAPGILAGSGPLLLLLGLLGFVVLTVTLILHRFLLHRIEHVTGVIRKISRGNLEASVGIESRDEFGDLSNSLEELTRSIRARIDAIEQQRSQLEAILEQLSDGILIVDRRGTVIMLNQAAEYLLSVERERALVRSYREVVRDHELVELIRSSDAADRTSGELPTRYIELGRPRRTVQAFAYTIAQAETQLVVVILRDITELRRTEMIRRDFVANVSHDLRTPVASLKALVETLLDGALEDESVAREFLNRMDVEVDSLARLVEELLDLSRAESRSIALAVVPADLSELAHRAIERLQAQAEPLGVTIITHIPEDLPNAEVDPERIEQVIINLLENAIKFTGRGGSVTLRVESTAEDLIVTVDDEGPGIPQELRERVFERFFKGDRSRANTGSGLGLAIAKHLVHAHRGQIWVDGEYRDGARFRFSVPRAGK